MTARQAKVLDKRVHAEQVHQVATQAPAAGPAAATQLNANALLAKRKGVGRKLRTRGHAAGPSTGATPNVPTRVVCCYPYAYGPAVVGICTAH